MPARAAGGARWSLEAELAVYLGTRIEVRARIDRFARRDAGLAQGWSGVARRCNVLPGEGLIASAASDCDGSWECSGRELVSGSLLKSAIFSLLQFQASASFSAGFDSAHWPNRPEGCL